MDYTQIAAAVIVGVLSVARTVRLLAWDEFPPAKWLREHLLAWMGDKWGVLITCGFCLSPYIAAGMAVWAWLSDTNDVWWIINGVWGLSYAAAIIVSYDQPD